MKKIKSALRAVYRTLLFDKQVEAVEKKLVAVALVRVLIALGVSGSVVTLVKSILAGFGVQ